MSQAKRRALAEKVRKLKLAAERKAAAEREERNARRREAYAKAKKAAAIAAKKAEKKREELNAKRREARAAAKKVAERAARKAKKAKPAPAKKAPAKKAPPKKAKKVAPAKPKKAAAAKKPQAISKVSPAKRPSKKPAKKRKQSGRLAAALRAAEVREKALKAKLKALKASKARRAAAKKAREEARSLFGKVSMKETEKSIWHYEAEIRARFVGALFDPGVISEAEVRTAWATGVAPDDFVARYIPGYGKPPEPGEGFKAIIPTVDRTHIPVHEIELETVKQYHDLITAGTIVQPEHKTILDLDADHERAVMETHIPFGELLTDLQIEQAIFQVEAALEGLAVWHDDLYASIEVFQSEVTYGGKGTPGAAPVAAFQNATDTDELIMGYQGVPTMKAHKIADAIRAKLEGLRDGHGKRAATVLSEIVIRSAKPQED